MDVQPGPAHVEQKGCLMVALQEREDTMNAIVRPWIVSAVAAVTLSFAGCTNSAVPAADAAKPAAAVSPAVPVSARTAFNPMYKSAFTWASDVVLLQMTPTEVSGFTNDGGKAAQWHATWASPSLHKSRVDSYAIATVVPDIHKGAANGIPIPWAGPSREMMPIDLGSFTVDSDTAYAAGAADADAWLKKNPDKKLSMMDLSNGSRFHVPVWAMLWGDKKSGYLVFVDASTGKVLKMK